MAHRLSYPAADSAACGIFPRPGIEPTSPALAGGFLPTAPPGKSSRTSQMQRFSSLHVCPQALSVLTTRPFLSWVGLPGASLVPSLSPCTLSPVFAAPLVGAFTAGVTHQLCNAVASCLPASDGCWVPGLYRHPAEQWGCPGGQGMLWPVAAAV